MKYKCIIFDCDGVLVDSELITAEVIVSMAKELGLNLKLNFVLQEFMGKSLNDLMQFIEKLNNGFLPPDFESEYRRKTFEEFKNKLKPIDGIHSVLKNLKIPFCVASSGPLKKIHRNLTTVGLIDLFQDRIFSCYEIKRWKPDPAIFLYAAENMGFKPEECAVIEDSSVGVQAALSGGFDVFMYRKNDNNHHFDNNEIITFKAMDELQALLS